jgi:toxin HigB-1
MIKTFRDSQTQQIFEGQPVKRLDHVLAKKARRRLEFLHAAVRIEDLYHPPSNHFHALSSSPIRYAIAVNQQWRITFEWAGNDAYNVAFEDYHP